MSLVGSDVDVRSNFFKDAGRSNKKRNRCPTSARQALIDVCRGKARSRRLTASPLFLNMLNLILAPLLRLTRPDPLWEVTFRVTLKLFNVGKYVNHLVQSPRMWCGVKEISYALDSMMQKNIFKIN